MSKSLFVLIFLSFPLFARNLSKDERRSFSARNAEKLPPRELVTVRRWHRSEAAEGRWGSLTKCGVTKLVTVRRVYDGPSCRFVMKFIVIPVPRFQELKYFETRPSMDRCAYDGPSHLPSRGMKKAAEEIALSMG